MIYSVVNKFRSLIKSNQKVLFRLHSRREIKQKKPSEKLPIQLTGKTVFP